MSLTFKLEGEKKIVPTDNDPTPNHNAWSTRRLMQSLRDHDISP